MSTLIEEIHLADIKSLCTKVEQLEEINAHLIRALMWVKQRYEEEWTYEMGVGEVVSEIIQRFEQGEEQK